MASFSRYKSEGFVNKISTNVARTCQLSLFDHSLAIWCHSFLYFARYPQPKTDLRSLLEVEDVSRNREQNHQAPNYQRTITKRQQKSECNIIAYFFY